MNNNALETECLLFFKEYLRNRKEFQMVEDNRNKSDICADVMAKRIGGGDVYFEIKSTEAKKRIFNRISVNEILSSIDADKRRYEYFFVVIHKTVGAKKYKYNFVYHQDAIHAPFMTLNEMLGFTERGKNFFAIDFNIHLRKGKQSKRKDIFDRVKDGKCDDVQNWVIKEKNDNCLNSDILERKRKSIENLKEI